MKISCIIIDDEPIARKGIAEYIAQIDFLELKGEFSNAKQLLTALPQVTADLFFLDIEMPTLSGTDFLRLIKDPPMVIITTAYPEYALEGYELDVVDYLVKPFTLPRFLKAANKAREIFLAGKETDNNPQTTDYFFIKENGRYIKIHFSEILYIEALQNYVSIYLPHKKVISYITLSKLEKQLAAEKFLRIHKSYIISLEMVEAIEGNLVIIGMAKIPISRNIKVELMQKLIKLNLFTRKP